MFLAHIPPSPTQADDDARYYRYMLHIMIERGTDVAQALHSEITTGDPRDRSPTAVQDFELVNRGTRRAILLAQKIANDHADTPRTAPSASGAQTLGRADAPDTVVPDPAAHHLAPERLDHLDRDDDRGNDRASDTHAPHAMAAAIVSIAADISPDLASDVRETIAYTDPDTILPAIANCLAASQRRSAIATTPTPPSTQDVMAERSSPRFQPRKRVERLRRVDPATHATPPEQAPPPQAHPTKPNPPNTS